jgi:CIC family chloride channel protein
VTKRLFSRIPGPAWIKPALGGLMLGVLATPAVTLVGRMVGVEGQGLGILGGGYGAVQASISGAPWIPPGWNAVLLLIGLSMAKILAASLTIGSGGSAGDFAPSLAIGGLFGGAFGRAAELLLHDPRIDPGAFALVGMGAFYGAVAHVPLAALVIVCELAGNYDLLVPLMLALAIALAALRRKSLYEAQMPTLADSPVHRDALLLDVLIAVRVKEVMAAGRPLATLSPDTPAREVLKRIGEASGQDVFPVLDGEGRVVGLIASETAHVLAAQMEHAGWAIAADLMQPAVSVSPDDTLRTAAERLLANGLRELPVVGEDGRLVAIVDEAEIARIHLASAQRAERAISDRP